MNEKCNKNAKVDELAIVRHIVIDPFEIESNLTIKHILGITQYWVHKNVHIDIICFCFLLMTRYVGSGRLRI